MAMTAMAAAPTASSRYEEIRTTHPPGISPLSSRPPEKADSTPCTALDTFESGSYELATPMPIAMPTGIIIEKKNTMATALNASVWSMSMRRAWRPEPLAAAGLPSKPSELRRTVELSFRAPALGLVGVLSRMPRWALVRARPYAAAAPLQAQAPSASLAAKPCTCRAPPWAPGGDSQNKALCDDGAEADALQQLMEEEGDKQGSHLATPVDHNAERKADEHVVNEACEFKEVRREAASGQRKVGVLRKVGGGRNCNAAVRVLARTRRTELAVAHRHAGHRAHRNVRSVPDICVFGRLIRVARRHAKMVPKQ
eukprot:352470-Chlamydomonas_euryale.AAC.12